MTSFYGVLAAFRTCKTTFQRLSAWVHVEPNNLAFECIRLLLNVSKWLLEWLLKIPRALLVFGNNLHRVMLPVPRARSGRFLARRAFTFTFSANNLRPVKRSPRLEASGLRARPCEAPSKFHNFRINDPAIFIQSSYFITDFKESKSTKKKNFERG